MSIADEQYRALFELANEGIFVADAKGRFLDVNRAGCLMLGYTTEEITRMTIADIISEDEHGRIVPKMEKNDWEEQIHSHWKLIRKDHSVIIGDVKSVKLSDGRLQAIISNVTEYMQERKIVGKQEEYLRPTLDYMLEGCQIIGFDWRYLYINSAAEIQNRRPNEELLGKSFTQMWPGIESTNVYKGIKKALEERVPIHLEEFFTHPYRDEGWFDISIQPVPEGVFILSMDITERKLAEQALLDSE